MLFKQRFLDGIAEGNVSLAFRSWRRPSVKAGGRLRTAAGELAILTVEETNEESLSERDAVRAGYRDKAELLRELATCREGTLYKISFTLAGPDTRTALREQAEPTAEDVAEITRRLNRLDAAAAEPWTERVLHLIAQNPGVRAGDLAAAGGFEKEWLKLNIRKLKNLGLTESLTVGYRLSPRGRTYLETV